MTATTYRLRTAAAVAAIAAVPVLAACSDDSGNDGNDTTVTVTQGATDTAATSASDAPTTGAPQRDDLATMNVALSWRDALAIAQRDFNGKPTSIKLSTHLGNARYEITLVSDREEAELDVDANTRAIVDRDVDILDGDDVVEAKAEILDLNGVIEPDKAMEAATKKVSGRVTDWKLKKERGKMVYEVGVDTAPDDVDVIIDAKSGEVLGQDR